MSTRLPNPVDRWHARLTRTGQGCLALAALLVVAWSVHLWPQWSSNPDLSHGLFTPVVFVFLIVEAARRGTPRYLPSKNTVTWAIAVLLVLGLAFIAIGALFAAAVEWTHALVGFVLASGLSLLLAALWVWAAEDRRKLVPLNWPAFVAVAIWTLSAPIPPGTYTRLTLALQSGVTTVVLHALHFLGIAAIKDGHVIELANVSVGVEEACSGIRSLVSCVVVSLVLSALVLRTAWARAMVVVAAVPLAIGMNAVRSLGLTLLAHGGTDIRGAWHDATGFGVLAATAGVLAALAAGLRRLERRRAREPATPESRLPTTLAAGDRNTTLLGIGYGLAASLVVFFVVQTRPAPRSSAALPDLQSLLPPAPDGWDVATSTDLFRFSDQLHTDRLVQRSYARTGPKGLVQITVYLAHWPSGQAPVSLVASHTPEACWPGAGWDQKSAPRADEHLTLPQTRQLPPAHYRLFEQSGFPQHVWYWHLFRGRPVQTGLPDSPLRLMQIAWKYGFQKDGDQLFVRVSSNRPWSDIADEPVVAEAFARLQPHGL